MYSCFLQTYKSLSLQNRTLKMKSIKITENLLFDIVLFILVCTVLLIITWVVYFIIDCHRLCKQYKLCQQKPLLHPLHADVQYLSKTRKLYNLKTHITKYVLMITISVLEIFNIIWWVASSEVQTALSHHNHTMYSNCSHKNTIALYHAYPFIIPLHCIRIFLTIAYYNMLCILSRYLVARYLNHPYARTMLKYLIWVVVQFLIIGILTINSTIIVSLYMFPLLILIDWILLVKDTKLLSTVLASNLRDIMLYSDNRTFYNRQFAAYRFYRFARLVLIVSNFFLFLTIMFFDMGQLYNNSFYCGFDKVYRRGIDQLYSGRYLIEPTVGVMVLLYSIAMSLPLWMLTLYPIVLKCVKRFREKSDEYRYNYEKLGLIIK